MYRRETLKSVFSISSRCPGLQVLGHALAGLLYGMVSSLSREFLSAPPVSLLQPPSVHPVFRPIAIFLRPDDGRVRWAPPAQPPHTSGELSMAKRRRRLYWREERLYLIESRV